MTTIPDHLRQPFADALLAGADDDFLIGHCASDWTGLAPMLEEDIAFSSIAQDEIAHARELYQFVGQLLNRSADSLAYARSAGEYRCADLVVTPDDFDWSALLARQFYYDHFDSLRLARWCQSSHAPFAHLARRIAAEETFHVHHVDDWMSRLGRNPDSRARLQSALDKAWPAAERLFEETADAQQLAGAGLLPLGRQPIFSEYKQTIAAVLERAGLTFSAADAQATHPLGGRRGKHAPQLESVLTELSEVYRLDPQATW